MTVDELRDALEGIAGSASVRISARYGSWLIERVKYASDEEFILDTSSNDD